MHVLGGVSSCKTHPQFTARILEAFGSGLSHINLPAMCLSALRLGLENCRAMTCQTKQLNQVCNLTTNQCALENLATLSNYPYQYQVSS